MTAAPLSAEQRVAILARRAAYQSSHNHMGAFACCTAHASADDVPMLLREIDQLRAELACARRALSNIEADAERADRKGYDLDAADIQQQARDALAAAQSPSA
jgi:hypothetical protein